MKDSQALLSNLLLNHEVEQFLYAEAALLDERRFKEWLDLLADDIRYFVPLARNVKFGHQADEFSKERSDIAWMDEGKETLEMRVKQLSTGIHWAEEPVSRVTRMISNVRIIEAGPDPAAPERVTVGSRLLLWRNRQETETDFYIGKRSDVLRRHGDSWLIERREFTLDQNVLLAKNITTFF